MRSFTALLLLSILFQAAICQNELSDDDLSLLQKRFFVDVQNKENYCSWSTGCKPKHYCKLYRGHKFGECVSKKAKGSFCMTNIECMSDECSWLKCEGKTQNTRK